MIQVTGRLNEHLMLFQLCFLEIPLWVRVLFISI